MRSPNYDVKHKMVTSQAIISYMAITVKKHCPLKKTLIHTQCYAALSPKHHAHELLIAAGFYYTHICKMQLYAVSEKTKTQIQAIIATEIINQAIKKWLWQKSL